MVNADTESKLLTFMKYKKFLPIPLQNLKIQGRLQKNYDSASILNSNITLTSS